MIKLISKYISILSGIMVFNLVAVIVISNYIASPPEPVKPYPTPIIKINKIIKKVQLNTDSRPNNNSTVNTNIPTVINTPSCIVTIDGMRYDIIQFRQIHSGGDIFSCGANMSADFWSRHSQRQLNQMQRYRI